jgi:hypothetical protein
MEPFIQKLFEQGFLVILMGLIIYIQYKKNEKLDKEILRLQGYIIDREKEFAEERMSEQKETIETLNDVATALTQHNKLTEYEQHNRKKT